MQEQLESLRQRYADLYDRAPVGCLILDCGGRIRDINLTGARLLGRSREGLIGLRFRRLVNPSDHRKYRRHLALCRTHGGVLGTALSLACKSGERARALELISTWDRETGAKGRCYKSVLFDITVRREAERALCEACGQLERRVAARTAELTRANAVMQAEIAQRRQAQEALQRSQENLNDFFEQSPLSLFWVSRQGRVWRANKAGVLLLGRPRLKGARDSVVDFFTDRRAGLKLLGRLARGEVVRDCRARLHGRDGRLRHVLIDANGVWDDGRMSHSRWFMRDITRRVKLEREILVAGERERERLGQDLHDNLCQQLAGIEFLSHTLAGQLRERSAPETERAMEIARMIREAIMHTREMAHGLSPMPGGSARLCDALELLAERTRKAFQIDCRFRCGERLADENDAVGIHLYRIAQEAVTNAIKHGKAARVDIILKPSRDKLILAVSDSGMGMPRTLREAAGMGLRAMEYRAEVIGGNLLFKRNSRGGAVVVCEVSDAGLNQKNRSNHYEH